MKITRIEKQEKRDRYNLYSEDQFVGALGADVLVGSGLTVGVDISESRLSELLGRDVVGKALLKAYDYVARRPHSTAELRDKLLRKEHPNDVVDEVINRLQESGYLDDVAFAKLWIEQRGTTRGPRLLRAELMKKGVSSDDMAEAFGERVIEDNDLTRLIQKRMTRYDGQEWPQVRDKLMRYLAGRGYDFDAITTAIRNYEASVTD